MSGTSVKVYVNGVQKFTITLASVTSSLVRTLNRVGASYWCPPVSLDDYSNAAIDQLKIYTIALSQAQVQQDMSFTSYSACKSPN